MPSDEVRVEAEPLNDAEGKALVAGLRQHMIGGIVTLTEDALDRLMATLDASEALRVEAERERDEALKQRDDVEAREAQLAANGRLRWAQIEDLQAERAALRERSAQLEAALRWYAEPSHYAHRCGSSPTDASLDCGRRAEAALALPVTEEADTDG